MKILDLQKKAFKTAMERGQYDLPQTPKSLFMRVVQELSEAAEEIQKGKTMAELYIENGKPMGVPVELADCVIAIMSICELHQVDLQKAIDLKMAYNKTRAKENANS